MKITKKIKDLLIKKAHAQSDVVEPCSGKTIDQCIVYHKSKDQFLFYFNDKTGSTRLVME